MFTDRLLSCSADGRLFHDDDDDDDDDVPDTVGPWKTKLRWSTDVSVLLTGRHVQVDADRSRGRSLNFLHRHAGFLQIWRRDAVDAFPYEDRGLENNPSPYRKTVEAAYD